MKEGNGLIDHRNNIGLLRLLLASAVIIGHAPELIDGDRNREPITSVLPYASMGDLAVAGFFFLSGYLIVKSMIVKGALLPYFEARMARIVPGFLAAYILTVFGLPLLLEVNLNGYAHEAIINGLFLKAPPLMPKIGTRIPSINGALWTIAYEFRCYILVAALWYLGILDNRKHLLFITMFLVVLSCASASYKFGIVLKYPAGIRWFDLLFGDPTHNLTFFSTFMVGSTV